MTTNPNLHYLDFLGKQVRATTQNKIISPGTYSSLIGECILVAFNRQGECLIKIHCNRDTWWFNADKVTLEPTPGHPKNPRGWLHQKVCVLKEGNEKYKFGHVIKVNVEETEGETVTSLEIQTSTDADSSEIIWRTAEACALVNPESKIAGPVGKGSEENSADLDQVVRNTINKFGQPKPGESIFEGSPHRKLAVRRRLAAYVKYLQHHRKINRSDVMRIGEISTMQASTDLAALREDYPELGLFYDTSAKTYRMKRDIVASPDAKE